MQMQPNYVLEDLIDIVNATGSVGVIGVYIGKRESGYTKVVFTPGLKKAA